jgi:hypothetical protein
MRQGVVVSGVKVEPESVTFALSCGTPPCPLSGQPLCSGWNTESRPLLQFGGPIVLVLSHPTAYHDVG